MIFIIIGLCIAVVAQRIQLYRERRSHDDTRRALIWWREERGGRHGHGGRVDDGVLVVVPGEINAHRG